MIHFVHISAALRYSMLLVAVVSSHAAWAEESAVQTAPTDGQKRVILLRDGGVLVGKVQRDGDRVVVSRSGAEVRVPAANILFDCDSFDEAYQRRRQQMARPTVESHVALADWCLRYDLLDQARRELAIAKSLDARHPRVALLDRRLTQTGEKPRQPPAATPLANDEPASLSRPNPAAGSQVAASLATNVSPQVVERFTRKVQPVLVNNCTTSGCHQPGGAQSFQLDRALLHGMANRRSTMSNLAAALALVDRERPQLSALLTIPREAHGGMDRPVFGPRQQQAYNHLVEWVVLVTYPNASSAQPAPTDAEASVAAVASDGAEAGKAVSSQSDADAESGAVSAKHLADSIGLAPAVRRIQFGARVEKWKPRDEFDPEIFNRQIRRHRPADLPDASAFPHEDP